MKTLQDLKDLVTKLREDNSTSFKKAVLSKVTDPGVKELLRLTYDTHTKFFLTLENVNSSEDQTSFWEEEKLSDWPAGVDPLKVFSMLSSREVTGDAAIKAYKSARSAVPESLRETFDLILSRDLKAKVSTSLLDEAFPGMFKLFSVQLAEEYEPKRLKTPKVVFGRKLDGIRCLIVKQGQDIKAFSREGKEFFTVDVLLKDFRDNLSPWWREQDFVVDGELCLVDKDGNEDFTGIVSMFRRKNFTIPNPVLVAFDILTYQEFVFGGSPLVYTKRYKTLEKLLDDCSFKNFRLWTYETVNNTETDLLMKKLEEASDRGWEGLIVRNDVPYVGKRSNAILKMKKFFDAEFEVLRVNVGKVDDGKGNKVDAATDLIIKLDKEGNEVGVGTGLTLA